MRRVHLALLVAALLTGLGLRLVALTVGTLELDEAYTVIQASHPVVDILRLAPTDPNPPATNLAFHAWTRVFGTSELAWESLSMVLGLAAIALLSGIATRRFGPQSGMIAAWLLAVSPVHVVYSQQMRSYALALVVSLITVEGLLRDLEAPSRLHLGWWLAGCWLLVNTHYYGLLLVAAFFVAAMVVEVAQGRSARIPWRLLGAGLLLGVALLPTGVALYLQYTRYYSFDWIPAPSARLLLDLLTAFGGRSNGPTADLLATILWSAAIVGGNTLLRHRSEGDAAQQSGRWHELVVLGSWLLVPTVLAFAVSALGRPFLHPRYIVLWLLPLLLLAARGLAALPRTWHRITALAAILLCAAPGLLLHYANRYESADAKRAFERIAEGYREGDVVLHLSKVSWAPAIYYHDEMLEEYFLDGTPSSNVMRHWMPERDVTLGPDELDAYRRVWVYRWPRLPSFFSQLLERLPSHPGFQARAPRLVEADAQRTLLLYELTKPPTSVLAKPPETGDVSR